MFAEKTKRMYYEEVELPENGMYADVFKDKLHDVTLVEIKNSGEKREISVSEIWLVLPIGNYYGVWLNDDALLKICCHPTRESDEKFTARELRDLCDGKVIIRYPNGNDPVITFVQELVKKDLDEIQEGLGGYLAAEKEKREKERERQRFLKRAKEIQNSLIGKTFVDMNYGDMKAYRITGFVERRSSDSETSSFEMETSPKAGWFPWMSVEYLKSLCDGDAMLDDSDPQGYFVKEYFMQRLGGLQPNDK